LSWATIIGIDPGLTGAVAYLLPEGGAGVMDTPVFGSEMSETACVQLIEEIQGLHPGPPILAVLEKVHAMPRQGVSSTFKFGMGYGVWRGILAAKRIPMHLVTPQEWQKKILAGLPKGKGSSMLQAQRLFPDLTPLLTRKKDDGRADALCLAQYGRMYLAK
jgi:crossover junction endodeoxyribonuclease RuvC